MRRALILTTAIAALTLPFSAIADARPPIPQICGPDMMCHVEPLPTLPPLPPVG